MGDPSFRYTIYAVDFDGTLCESVHTGIGAPNMALIEHLKKKRLKGDKVILWSCRTCRHLQEAVEWCRGYGLEFDAVNDNLPETIEKYGSNSRKVFAHVYIDDKMLNKAKYHVPYFSEKEDSFEKQIFECMASSCKEGMPERDKFRTYMASLSDDFLFEAFDEAEDFRNTGILKGPEGRVREIRAAWEDVFGSKPDVSSVTEELYYEMARRLRKQTNLYAVAFLRKNGKGFSKTEPFLTEPKTVAECALEYDDLIEEGFQNVTIFKCSGHRESYDWDYVNHNRVERSSLYII